LADKTLEWIHCQQDLSVYISNLHH
jgi:hypothetical protein